MCRIHPWPTGPPTVTPGRRLPGFSKIILKKNEIVEFLVFSQRG